MKLPRFTIRGFPILESLGPLELKTLEEVWRRKEVDVYDIIRSLGGDIAYTTVMTTLDRLHTKGYLNRRKMSRAYYYSARKSRDELNVGLASDLRAGIIGSATKNVEPVLSCIVDTVSERDIALFDKLERLIKAKKKALR